MLEVKIIVASHGNLSKELVKSAEMIAGPMKNVESLSLMPKVEPDEFKKEVIECIEDNSSTIALVDLFGGSPANVISSLIESYDIDIITGMSLPMLLELYFNMSQNQFESNEELINNTIKIGTEGIVHVNRILMNREETDDFV